MKNLIGFGPKVFLTFALVFAIPQFLLAARQFGGFYTAERMHNALENVAKYRWARNQRDLATSNAAVWLRKSDEELWNLVPGQSLPRCIDVTWDYNHPEKPRIGCLKCGENIFKYGNYPYTPDIWKAPWKLKCPSCGAIFPTNDFGKYYKSGINEHGLFDPAKADRSLLFNAQHPDPSDPLHTFGVDDGFGYVDANGRVHKFIGYYTWKLWNQICSGVSALSQAYVLTGHKIYARKAAILLDRIADVYPDMDWKPYADLGWYHSDGGTHKGKIGGRIWETSILANFARDYDMILGGTNDNPQLFAFLKKKGEQFSLPRPKSSADVSAGNHVGQPGESTQVTSSARDLFVANVDDRILRCGAAAVKTGQIAGNDGMKQHAIISAAIALNTSPETQQWIDWAFDAKGGELPEILMSGLDRDGTGEEGAPNYSLLWIDKILAIAELLAAYPEGGHDLYSEFPQLRNSFTAGWRMLVLGLATPNIGDSGATGLMDRMQCDPKFIARGFKAYHDPDIARAAYEANSNSAAGLLVDIFAKDPLALNHKLMAAAKSTSASAVRKDSILTRNRRENQKVKNSAFSPQRDGNINMPGFGLAKLEFGDAKTGSAIWCYYGRNGGHGHHDQLNFSIYGFGVDLAPDHGYPEFATPTWLNRVGWTANTLAHNTVVVDKSPQTEVWDGQPRFFNSMDTFGAFEIGSNKVYPQTGEYARTMLFVDLPGGNAYALDVFRVSGGKDHLLSFHGPPGKVIADGLHLDRQTSGTYAGEDVTFGEHATTIPLGYSYLYNVERDTNPPGTFYLDWDVEAGYRGVTARDRIHLRSYFLTQCDDIALADGDPPQNKLFNPRRIRYSLLHRSSAAAGSDPPLSSTFSSIIEPYRGIPFIKTVTRLETTPADDRCVAVRVEMKDGTLDYLLSCPDGEEVQVAGGISFAARAAFIREREGSVVDAKLVYGSRLDYKSVHLTGEPKIEGTVVEMEKDPKRPAVVLVKADIKSTSCLIGDQIIFANDGKRNACYTVSSIQPDGGLYRISCTPGSFVRGFRDRRDYSKGYVYEFDQGTSFTIPNHASLTGATRSGAPSESEQRHGWN